MGKASDRKGKEKQRRTQKRKKRSVSYIIGDEASAVETVFPRKETSLLGQLKLLQSRKKKKYEQTEQPKSKKNACIG